MDAIDIRPAGAADLPRIRAILRDAYAPALARLAGLPDVTSVRATDLATCRVAVVDGTVAGAVFADLAGPAAHLENLAVDPAAAGRGIGAALVRDAEARAAAAGAAEMVLATHPGMAANHRFYTRLGYAETRRDAGMVVFAKPLGGPAPLPSRAPAD